jgi:hypothetical protein
MSGFQKRMKTVFLLACVFVSAIAVFGQPSQVEKDFESKKTSYTFEHFAEGEDATSGYDYLFYKSGDDIVKIRSIWSASHTKELRIEDLYFGGSDLLLLRRFTAAGRLLNTLKKGRNGVLAPKEEFYFTGAKLTKWVDGGKEKSPGDADWAKAEKEVLDHAKSQREYYRWLKEGKF